MSNYLLSAAFLFLIISVFVDIIDVKNDLKKADKIQEPNMSRLWVVAGLIKIVVLMAVYNYLLLFINNIFILVVVMTGIVLCLYLLRLLTRLLVELKEFLKNK